MSKALASNFFFRQLARRVITNYSYMSLSTFTNNAWRKNESHGEIRQGERADEGGMNNFQLTNSHLHPMGYGMQGPVPHFTAATIST